MRKRDLDAFLLEIQKFINDCANLFPGRDLKETIDYNLDLSKFTPVEMQERRTQQNLRKKGKWEKWEKWEKHFHFSSSSS